MKILFITDFAAIQQDPKSCMKLYGMVRKCILQVLIYLKQSHSHLNNPINVGFKCCDTRAQFEIPRDISNAKKKFHPFTSTTDILKRFSTEYKSTHSSRKTRLKKQTPSSSSYMTTNTPTTSMTLQLRDKPGLSQIIIALLQCIKQYAWTSTALETHNNNNNNTDDNFESQMIFILSSLHNIDDDREWKKSIKYVSNKYISINYIYVHSLWDTTPSQPAIDNMHLCLQKLSYLSIGVVPLTLLWISPILKLQHQFIKIFKSKKNMLFPSHKLYQESIKWNGNIYINQSLNSLRRSKRLKNNNKLLINCDLISIECNKRYNKPPQQENENNNIYDDVLKNINFINIEGILDGNCLQKMDHLPYISLIIRPTKQNTKLETQQFQQLFANTICANPSQYFVVKFNDNCNYNIKGVMYGIIPSFVMLKIYVMCTWNTKSKLINVSTNISTTQNLNDCIKSMLNINPNNNHNNHKCIINHKKKVKINQKMKVMKGKLAVLYRKQLNNEEKQKEDNNIDNNLNNNNNNNTNDMNHLEIRINNENKNKSIQEQFEEICKVFVHIHNMLLCKQSLKRQHVHSFIDITYKSFYNLCTSDQLFNDISVARKNIKYFLQKEIFIDPSAYAKIRDKKNLNIPQQIFDIKIQILLLLQYGCIHFRDEILLDPIARFKYFDAYLQKLYIKDVKSHNEFIDYITHKYAHKLPKTFAKYYQNKEEDIPTLISSYLNNSNHNISQNTERSTSSLQPQTINHKKTNRKRRYSDMMMMQNESIHNEDNNKRFKKAKHDNQLKNVIITPMLANKTKNTNQKIVSSSSRRTLSRSQRGSGALRSGKRPLRLVLGDKTNSSHTNGKKKRKLTHSSTSITHADAPQNKYIFSVNSNNNSNPITNSAMKLRSSEWVKQNKVYKKHKNRKQKRKPQTEKTPPLLKRCRTESNLLSISDELQANNHNHKPTFSFGLSKTQSMSDLSKFSENLAQHSPSEDALSLSPLIQPLTRTCSAMDIMLNKQRVTIGDDNDEGMVVDDNINNAMHPDWCELDDNDELPPDNMAKEVYIHPLICGNYNNNQYVPASQTNSVVPPTPTPNKNISNQRFCFGGGYAHKDDNDIFMLGSGFRDGGNNSNNRNIKFVPETPDNGGNGASNIKSHCKINLRNAFQSEDQNMEDFMTKKRLNRQISFAGL